MSVLVDFDFRAIAREGARYDDIAMRQLPFAAAKSLTQSAKQATDKDIPAEMDRVFDRPTRYTKRVLAFLPATKKKLQAEILPRSFAGKGNVAWDYLDPEVVGGLRKPKRSEKRLKAVLGQDVFLLPATGVRLDAAGNLSRGTMVKVLSGLGALGDQSATKASAKRAKRKIAAHGKKNNNSPYFIGRDLQTGKPRAIYELKSKGKVKPVMIITRKPPRYQPRFNFEATVQRSITRSLPSTFNRNLAEAIRTARP